MDRDTALANARFKIGQTDADNSDFTDEQIVTVIDRSLKKTALVIAPVRTTAITSVAEQQEYDLTTGTLEVLDVTYDGQPVEYIPYKDAMMASNGISGAYIYSTPSGYYLDGTLTIGFAPIPSVAGKTINVRNRYEPADLASGSTSLPYTEESYNELIILDAVVELLSPNYKEEAVYWNGMKESLEIKLGLASKGRLGADYVTYYED